METQSSMKKVAEQLCEKHGHSLARIEPATDVLCSKCGMTLDEIRGEGFKARAA
jgi:protein-arginine kinase activator protein McsA